MALLSEAELAKVKKDKEASRAEGKGFATEAGVRSEAAAAKLRKLRGEADTREQTGVGAIDAATKAAQVRARRRTAKGLAAAQGAGGFGSGAKSAQLQDVGQKLGEEETKIGVGGALGREEFLQKSQARRFGQEGMTGQAEVDASVQKLEGTKFKKEAGTELEDRQAKGASYNTQMAEIKAAHKGEGWLESDDEPAAARAIQRLADLEDDPVLKKMLQDEAARIIKEGDLAF
jgi:hypothetical protein